MAPRLPKRDPRLLEFALFAARPSEVNAPRRLSSQDGETPAGLLAGVAVVVTLGICSVAAGGFVCLFTGEVDPAGTSWFITLHEEEHTSPVIKRKLLTG